VRRDRDDIKEIYFPDKGTFVVRLLGFLACMMIPFLICFFLPAKVFGKEEDNNMVQFCVKFWVGYIVIGFILASIWIAAQ